MTKLSSFTGGIAQTNGWLLELEQGALVFDAPDGMAAWLERKRVRPSSLLLTHQHFDHVLDAAAIQAAHGCPVLAWSPLSRALTLEDLYNQFAGGGVVVPEFEVSETLAGRSQIAAGGMPWSLLHIPGHSPDSVCFHQPDLGLVFDGDVLFMDGIGRTDFPGGSSSLLLGGIEEKLMPLPDATRVLPGHGPETTIGRERMENPFLGA